MIVTAHPKFKVTILVTKINERLKLRERFIIIRLIQLPIFLKIS